MPLKIRRHRAALAVATLLAGCGAPPPEAPVASGTFRGTDAAGEEIVLTVEQDGLAVRGEGAVGGEPIALAGPVTWSAVGTLVRADGSSSPVRLGLSADGERLAFATPEGPLLLERGGNPVESSGGPFSGRYEAAEDGAVLAEMTVVQSGELLSGVGTVFGEPAGVSGRVLTESRAAGVVTFLDESQLPFEADLSDSGDVTLRGFGDPLELERQ